MGIKRSMESTDDYLINDLAPDDDYDLDVGFDELTYDYFVEEPDAEDSSVLEFAKSDEPASSAASPRSIPAKGRKRFAVAFTVLAAIGIAASVWSMGEPLLEEYRSEQKVGNLRQERLVTFSEDAISEDTPKSVENPYADIFSQNEDMVAWLVVGDTVIDYPVMQTLRDEEYYLHRDFYGEPDNSGCLLLDTDSSLYDSAATSNLSF